MAQRWQPKYADDATAQTAGFPAAIYTMLEYVDSSTEHGEETITITQSADEPTQYYIPTPRPNTSLSLTVDGNSRTKVNNSTTPGSGQWGYSNDGLVTLYSSDAAEGNVIAITLTPLRTVIRKDHIHRLQAELIATQNNTTAIIGGAKTGVDLTATGNTLLFTATEDFIPTSLIIRMTAASGIGDEYVQFGAGVGSGAYDILDVHQAYGLKVPGKIAIVQLSGTRFVADGAAVYINVDVALPGTATATIYLMGIRV